MLRAALLLALILPAAHAGQATLLHEGPALADGVTPTVVEVHVPGMGANDRARLKSEGVRVTAPEPCSAAASMCVTSARRARESTFSRTIW